jgi:hypothetical protein
VLDMSLQYLRRSEPELRQGRLRINRTFARVMDNLNDDEESHLALADLYKRMIEGPFRKYGWVLHCLTVGRWADPPMLTQMRDTLVASGGWLGSLAGQVVLRDVRNGEAHETLIWDGVKEAFVTEGAEVKDDVVAHAVLLIDAFARGCEAAVSWYENLKAEHTAIRPLMDDPGRLSPWRRAEAIFGTNGVHLTRANFNSKIARIVCSTFREEDINPCFQALVVCHGLLPHVERFEVFTSDAVDSVVVASRDALERTLPIWERALNSLSVMPLSTFLPANLDSRLRTESLTCATRSVAWIAVDDFLDALDGSDEHLDAKELELFTRRTEIVSIAVEQCTSAVPLEVRSRLRAVHQASVEMLTLLRGQDVPVGWSAIERSAPVAKFRHWWEVWGPVDRLPSVEPSTDRPQTDVSRPALRGAPGDLRWHTI